MEIFLFAHEVIWTERRIPMASLERHLHVNSVLLCVVVLLKVVQKLSLGTKCSSKSYLCHQQTLQKAFSIALNANELISQPNSKYKV